jgi:thiol-disulfide isomerase/thioredoxin
MLKCLFLCALLVGLSTQEVEQERESSRKTTVRNYIEEENKIESSTKQSSRNFVVRKNTHGMYVLNERNFDSFIKESITKTLRRGIFVKFYAPWCGHCKELEKPWEALTRAVELYQDSLNNETTTPKLDEVIVGTFDCDTGPQAIKFCKDSLNIQGFPQIVYYEGLEYQKNYLGTRDFKDLCIFFEWESGLYFPFLNGLNRYRAIGFRIICEVMQYAMNTYGEDGAKPSGKALITFGIFVSIPLILFFGCLAGIGYCCCLSPPGGKTNPNEDALMSETIITEEICCETDGVKEKINNVVRTNNTEGLPVKKIGKKKKKKQKQKGD